MSLISTNEMLDKQEAQKVQEFLKERGLGTEAAPIQAAESPVSETVEIPEIRQDRYVEVPRVSPVIELNRSYETDDSIPESKNGDGSGSFYAGEVVLDSLTEIGESIQEPVVTEVKDTAPKTFTLSVQTDSVFRPSKHLLIGVGSAQANYVADISRRLNQALYAKKGDQGYALQQRMLQVACTLLWKIQEGYEVSVQSKGRPLPRKMDVAAALLQAVNDNVEVLRIMIPFYVEEAKLVSGHIDRKTQKKEDEEVQA